MKNLGFLQRLFLPVFAVWLTGNVAWGYALEGYSYPAGSTINMQLGLTGPGSGHLSDGFTTFNQSAGDALSLWNQQVDLAKFTWVVVSTAGGHDDGLNQVFFGNSVYGQSFGGAIAVTLIRYSGSTIVEADTTFNSANKWDSYRGPLHYNAQKKVYTYDLHRVALHEFGHTLGLAHPDQAGQSVDAIMNSQVSNTDHLTEDDIAGARALYGFLITSSSTPDPSPVGESFSYQITANNSPSSFAAVGLPASLQVNSTTGLITGLPTTSGSYVVRVTASGATGAAAKDVTMTISPPWILTYSLSADVATNFEYKIQASSHPTSFEANGLPPGVGVDSVSGVISGIPTVPASYIVNLTDHTPYGDAIGVLYIQVLPPKITSPYLSGTYDTGVPFSYQITATAEPQTFAATGLAPGLTVDPATGLISGAPTISGYYPVYIMATGRYGTATGYLNLQVYPKDPPVATIHQAAFRMAADPLRPIVYLDRGYGSVALLDVNTLSVTSQVSLSSDLLDMCISLDGSRFWAYNRSTSSLEAYSLPAFIKTQSIAVSSSPLQVREGAGNQLYYRNGSPTLAQVDVSSGSAVRNFAPIDNANLNSLKTSADGTQLFVGSGYSSPATLWKYDITSTSPTLVQQTSQPGAGQNIVLNNAGDRVVFTTDTYGTNAPIPAPFLRSTADLALTFGALPSGGYRTNVLTFSRDDRWLFDFSWDNHRVDILDGRNALLGSVIEIDHAAQSPSQMVVDRDNRYLFLLSGLDILVYDVNLVTSFPTSFPPHSLTNVSTRMLTGAGDQAEIGGFIIKGTRPKRVGVRATGSSLSRFGLAGTLVDPILELRDQSNAVVAVNDNWNSNRQVVKDSGLRPLDEHEAVIVTTLAPGNYTAILRGVGDSTGISLLELYDLDPESSTIENISTRGNVALGDNVMIAGFVVGGNAPTDLIVRALGPTLADFGVSGVLADTVLELRNGSGTLVAQNDNWQSDQAAGIQATGYAPPNASEAAILATLAPGNYTAIVRGKNGTTGIGLVEVYNLDAN